MTRRAFTRRAFGAVALAGLRAPWRTLDAFGARGSQSPRSGNPILPGWYADPEARVFHGADGRSEYWIYPTYSAPYNEQLYLDAFSSTDLVTWTKHPRVLDAASISWARRAIWAPSILRKDDWYYLFFSANDIQNDEQVGGQDLIADVMSGARPLYAAYRHFRTELLKVLEEFRSRYVLTFTPQGVPAGGFHQLEVKVRRSGLRVRARPGYVSSPPGGDQ